MDGSTLARLRAELDSERAVQLEQLGEHGADPYGDEITSLGAEEGFADSAQATAERNELLALVETARGRLRDIDRALARMDEGSYGTCMVCGRPIDPDRLEVRPLSVLCIEDAAREAG